MELGHWTERNEGIGMGRNVFGFFSYLVFTFANLHFRLYNFCPTEIIYVCGGGGGSSIRSRHPPWTSDPPLEELSNSASGLMLIRRANEVHRSDGCFHHSVKFLIFWILMHFLNGRPSHHVQCLGPPCTFIILVLFYTSEVTWTWLPTRIPHFCCMSSFIVSFCLLSQIQISRLHHWVLGLGLFFQPRLVPVWSFCLPLFTGLGVFRSHQLDPTHTNQLYLCPHTIFLSIIESFLNLSTFFTHKTYPSLINIMHYYTYIIYR